MKAFIASAFVALSLVCVAGQWPVNLVPRVIFYERPSVIPLEPAVLIHTLRYVTSAWFEVFAACNDTAVGQIFLGSLRRPQSFCTTTNKNIAYAYACYRVLAQNVPEMMANHNAFMAEFGLDPNDFSTNINTAVGLGNTVGFAYCDFMGKDGFNSLGNENPDGPFYGFQFADYTQYFPSQGPYDLEDPDRFQPTIENRNGGNTLAGTKFFGFSGIQLVQSYANPQTRFAKPFSFTSPKDLMKNFSAVYAKWSGNSNRKQAYKDQAAQLVNISATLTDMDKITAEFFESKNLVFGTPISFLAATTPGWVTKSIPWNVDDFVVWEFATNAAIWDTVILAWSVKRKRDAVRPITAIRHVYRNQNVTAWGGPGKGTRNIFGSSWRPYLRTMAHSEYPSASTCMCTGWAEMMRKGFGNDNFGFSFPFAKGTSGVEPGLVPAVNMTLGPYATFTQYAQVCGNSRALAGVHFFQSIADAATNCKIVGTLGYNKLQAYMKGTITQAMDPNDRDHFGDGNDDDVNFSAQD